jgi:hypothetical protein
VVARGVRNHEPHGPVLDQRRRCNRQRHSAQPPHTDWHTRTHTHTHTEAGVQERTQRQARRHSAGTHALAGVQAHTQRQARRLAGGKTCVCVCVIVRRRSLSARACVHGRRWLDVQSGTGGCASPWCAPLPSSHTCVRLSLSLSLSTPPQSYRSWCAPYCSASGGTRPHAVRQPTPVPLRTPLLSPPRPDGHTSLRARGGGRTAHSQQGRHQAHRRVLAPVRRGYAHTCPPMHTHGLSLSLSLSLSVSICASCVCLSVSFSF